MGESGIKSEWKKLLFFRKRNFMKKMSSIRIENVTDSNIDDLIDVCIPENKKDDPLFLEGKKKKKEWYRAITKRYGTVAKVAYVAEDIAGMIQWFPRPDEKLFEIICIYVPEQRFQQKGIATQLLKEFLVEATKPQPFFDSKTARGIITWAFEVPGYFPQHKFYQTFGFRPVSPDNPYLLYYPLEKDFSYTPRHVKYFPQEEDKCKALIFYDPSCPFCIYFSAQIKHLIRQISKDIPIYEVNKFFDEDEIRKRGNVPFCAVNGHPIKEFFMNAKGFQQEVKKALQDC